ncbi:hypothetical protein K1719_025577 [Acacia pycnantha]|nr:hypothetical protein K1719_025577 [Acacia pycnantha]
MMDTVKSTQLCSSVGAPLNEFTILISALDKEQAALTEIETLLQKNGKSISDFPSLPLPSSSTHANVDNHLIRQELNYDKVQLQKQSEEVVKSLNVDQQDIMHYNKPFGGKAILMGGDGNLGLPHDGIAQVEILDKFLIRHLDNPMQAIVSATYPDQSAGLCNGTRLRVTHLGKNVIEGLTLNGSNPNQTVLIHRMDMNPSDNSLPFRMKRRSFLLHCLLQ